MSVIISLVILIVGGPVLAFPELLPEAWRNHIAIGVTVAALASAVITLRPIRSLRIPLMLFAGAVALSAVLHANGAHAGLRHVTGIGLGVLTMAVIGTGASVESRLRWASVAVGVGGLGLVMVGLGSTYFGWDGQKLVLGSTSEQQKLLYPWLPQTQLPLPGLEQDGGWINSNALGGTALMVLPFMMGLVGAALRDRRWPRIAELMIGGLGVLISASAIWMSRSRTALLASVLLSLIVAVQWRSARRAVAAALLVGIVVFGFAINARRQAAPGIFESGVASTLDNLRTRVSYWNLAADTIATAPLLGIGVSNFHEGPPAGDGKRPYVAHAHNIFLQVALDVGLLGLTGYVWLFGWVATRGRMRAPAYGRRIAAGAALSIVAAHLFGLTDAIALGAKVGLFQWLCAGVLIAGHQQSTAVTDAEP
jgi:putative inorganic carbon (HCO3(-)) transporter